MFEDYIREQGLHVPADKMVEFVIRNELGVFFFDDICKVRAIHQIRPDGALVSTGEIPEGSSICIVTGEPEALIAASRRAAEEARQSLKGAKAAGVLVFSCFCRTLILGQRVQARGRGHPRRLPRHADRRLRHLRRDRALQRPPRRLSQHHRRRRRHSRLTRPLLFIGFFAAPGR